MGGLENLTSILLLVVMFLLIAIALLGLWQVNILDDNGNFKKYEYVTGWQNAIKILENTLKKLTK